MSRMAGRLFLVMYCAAATHLSRTVSMSAVMQPVSKLSLVRWEFVRTLAFMPNFSVCLRKKLADELDHGVCHSRP